MKRDMDLIREILLFVEEHAPYPNGDSVSFKKDGVSDLDISFHIGLLENAKFVVAPSNSEVHGSYLYKKYHVVVSITWQGYEFLDKIRDEKQWKRIKQMLSKTGDFSFETISRAASSLIAEQLKQNVPSIFGIIVVYLAGLLTKPFWK